MHPITTLIAASSLLATASAQTVFSTDFNTTLPAAMTPGTATLTGVQGYAGLGPAGNTFGGTFLRSETGNVVTLSLTSLPPHGVLRLDFLFAAIDSLDGAGAYPLGDFFKITIDGTTVCRESFANALPSQVQTYVPPSGVLLARHADLGFTTGPGTYFTDSAYWLGGDPYFASFAHSASTATITFGIEGPGIQPLADESWAMDNLRVQVGPNTQGTVAAYGLSCGPVLRATSVPRLGQTLGLSMLGLPPSTTIAFGAFGLSQAMFATFVLPMPLDGNGMPGCWLVQDMSLLVTLPFALGGTTGVATLPIPNSGGFLGLQMFSQGWAIAPGTNVAGLVMSNGLRLRVGVSTSVAILEDFNNDAHLDRDGSGGTWASGIASFAAIGGDGRHGTFAPELGTNLGLIAGKRTFEWNTDNTIIPATNTLTGAAIAVNDGKYFFDAMIVPADVRLRFVGTSPPQFTVAGRLDIQGEIDVAGQSLATMPLNTAPLGQVGGISGIFAGAGGQGGDRCNGLVGAQASNQGRPGQDARVLAGRAYAATVVNSGGRGSTVWPANGLNTSLIFATGGTVMYTPSACAGGAGGGHFAAGQPGVCVGNNHVDPITLVPPLLAAMGPPAAAGTAVQFFPFPPASGSTLSSEHFLVGGSGGGGAASNAALCFHLSRTWAPGGGGGGGGGALALRAGDILTLGALGRVAANGGTAASGIGVAASSQPAPGGGGSGGSLVLQAGRLAAFAGVLDVRGGAGGIYNRFANGVPATVPFSAAVQIAGGNGADGFVRCEVPGAPTTALLASMLPPPIAQNVAPLTEVDPLASCRSTYYSTGLVIAPEYKRYEIHATIGGVPIVFSDDPAVSTVQAQVGAAVRAWFQAATLDLVSGQVLEQRPWRTSVRSTVQQIGIADDALNSFRFLLVVDRAIAQQVTIDRVVVAYDI